MDAKDNEVSKMSSKTAGRRSFQRDFFVPNYDDAWLETKRHSSIMDDFLEYSCSGDINSSFNFVHECKRQRTVSFPQIIRKKAGLTLLLGNNEEEHNEEKKCSFIGLSVSITNDSEDTPLSSITKSSLSSSDQYKFKKKKRRNLVFT